MPSTVCTPPPSILDAPLASDQAFADWFNGPEGRQWVADSRRTGWECFDKLDRVGAVAGQAGMPAVSHGP